MAEEPILTQEQAREAAAYFNLASLLGRCILAADSQIKHPDANPPRMLTRDPSEPPPFVADDSEPEDEDEPAEDNGPAVYSEVSINNQINQLIALYTPGVHAKLKGAALYDLFHLASAQFSFNEKNLIEDKLSADDGNKMAIAWLITKRVFAVRHMDETILIISATEDFNRAKPMTFRPMDPTDEEFITETCRLCAKIYDKELSLPQVLDKLVAEFKRVERQNEIGRLSPIGSVPNGDSLNWLYRIISSKGRSIKRSPGNRHEQIVKQRKGDTLRLTKTNKQNGNTVVVEISQADKYLSKSNKTFSKMLLFTLQKMNAQNFPLDVGFSLQELVDIGMYSTTSNAARAIRDFFDQQKQTILRGTVKKGKKTIREEGGVLFYHYRLENGYVTLSVNENFNMEFIANYFTIFPRFAYALSNNAFNLVRYIFFLARQNTKQIKAKGSFTINLDSIRETLGLPAPADVKNRKYKQYIVDPIEEAIEEIETAIQTVPEAKDYSFTITPNTTDTSNINKWLEGYLEIGLSGDFAETFIKLATKAEADQARWDKIKTAELAKLAAKKEASETKAGDE